MEFFSLHPPRTQFFLGSFDTFLETKNHQIHLRGGKQCRANKILCIKDSKTGVVRFFKYQRPQKTGVVCGP